MTAAQKTSKSPRKKWFFFTCMIIILLIVLTLVFLSGNRQEQETVVKLTPTKTTDTPSGQEKKINYPDDLDYNTAANHNTIKHYQKYIAKKPHGKYVTEAGNKIKQLNAMPGNVRIVASRTAAGIKVYKGREGLWEADCSDGIIMVYIPPGKFIMGSDDYENSEKPPHEVQLDGYWIGKYEVTFAQYDKYCIETHKEKPDDAGWGRGNLPVISVSWLDAQAYCKWLSGKTGLHFKLPTEAQWEKAARGGKSYLYPWGEREPVLDLANYSNIKKTTPVGSYPEGQSPYGLMDMAGNLWEWCDDWFGLYDTAQRENPAGPKNGALRVLRGGSWFDYPEFLRCAVRFYAKPSYRGYVVGFRLCMASKF